MSTHTPGPWTVCVNDVNTTIESQYYTIAPFVANCDAHLIAAAPDMLEAHKENVRILGFLVNEFQGLVPGGKLSALFQCLERSNAVLAKAEGKS